MIDATGEGEVCALAGCAFRMGRSIDGRPQPFSMPRGYVGGDGKIAFANFDAGHVDPTNAEDLSRAICRGQTCHLKDHFGEQDRLLYVASLPGVREGRFIVGEQTLTFEDLVYERPVDKPVMQTCAHYDNHTKDWAFENDLAQEWVTVCGLWQRTTAALVPYGVIIPRGMDGILVAGRCVSMDHDASQSFRMLRDMQKLGEIAGLAAALAIKSGCSSGDVPYDRLREKLAETGCFPRELCRTDPWPTSPQEIREVLGSDTPGPGIWACRLQGDSTVEFLAQWVKDGEGEDLRKHAAMALGLMGRPEGLPLLRRMVIERDPATPGRGRVVFGQRRDHAAMYLVGKMADREILPVLEQILASSGGCFQDATHPLMAMLKIGAAHADLRDGIARTAIEYLMRPGLVLELELQVSTSGQESTRLDVTGPVRQVVARELARWGVRVPIPSGREGICAGRETA